MENPSCSICKGIFESAHSLVITKCNHVFHQDCLLPWLEKTPSCPNCRASVNNSSLVATTLASINPASRGAIPRTTSGVQTRNQTRKATNSQLRHSQSNVQNSTAISPNNSEEEQTVSQMRNDLSILHNMVERFSQQLDQLSLNHSLERAWPRELFPPLSSASNNPSSSASNNPPPNLSNNPPNVASSNPSAIVPNISNNISSIALSNSSKISNLMNSWNIRFDGSSSGFPISKFLYVISALTLDNLGGDFQLVCDHFHILVVGRAKDWYWHYRQSVPRVTWNPLCRAMKAHFSDHLSDNDIREMIRDRKQQIGESFEDYYTAILQLCDRLQYPLSENEMVEMLRRNLRPQLRKELFYLHIENIAHLRNLVLRRESLMGELERCNRPPPRKIHEIEKDEEEEIIEEDQVLEIENSRLKNMTCWNCRKVGHGFTDCLEDRTIFCYGCGKENVYKPNCPSCKSSGNGVRSGYRSKT